MSTKEKKEKKVKTEEEEKVVFDPQKIKVRVTFLEECLGTCPGDPDIYRKFIADHAPDAKTREEEVESLGVDEVIALGKTVFSRDEEGRPHLWDYQIKGFFKGACGFLGRVPGTKSKELKAYKKVIDGLVFVYPRKILFTLPPGGEVGECQRTLRVSGPHGDRVCLACSESVPAGTSIEFEIEYLDKRMGPTIIEWMDFGVRSGISQWRNSGKGRFKYEIIA